MRSVLATGAFWISTVERAAKTAAQTAAGVLTVDLATGPQAINWSALGVLTAVTSLYSVLMSIASIPVGNVGPSLASEVLTPPAPKIDA